jgi:hypothetical protein
VDINLLHLISDIKEIFRSASTALARMMLIIPRLIFKCRRQNRMAAFRAIESDMNAECMHSGLCSFVVKYKEIFEVHNPMPSDLSGTANASIASSELESQSTNVGAGSKNLEFRLNGSSGCAVGTPGGGLVRL